MAENIMVVVKICGFSAREKDQVKEEQEDASGLQVHCHTVLSCLPSSLTTRLLAGGPVPDEPGGPGRQRASCADWSRGGQTQETPVTSTKGTASSLGSYIGASIPDAVY